MHNLSANPFLSKFFSLNRFKDILLSRRGLGIGFFSNCNVHVLLMNGEQSYSSENRQINIDTLFSILIFSLFCCSWQLNMTLKSRVRSSAGLRPSSELILHQACGKLRNSSVMEFFLQSKLAIFLISTLIGTEKLRT